MVFFPCKYGFKQLTYKMCLDLAHFFKQYQLLTLIWLGFLEVGFEMRGGKITPCLKLARIILE